MKLTWLGHSCMKLETGGYTVILDPYSAGSVPGLRPLKEEADLVLCSHGHGDHSAEGEIKKISGRTNPFDIQFIDTWHDPEKGALRGTNKITVLMGEGLKIIHMGDIGCYPEEDQYRLMEGADVLMIPVGGYYTVPPEQAKEIADRIGAAVTIPMHFSGATYGYPVIKTVEAFTGLCDDVKEYGSEIELKKGMERQTAVLKPLYA